MAVKRLLVAIVPRGAFFRSDYWARRAADGGNAGDCGRYLVSLADRVSVAPGAQRFSGVAHHLLLFSEVGNGTWERINTASREQVRVTAGRDAEPSAGIIDSQTIKTTEAGGERGFDGGKKSNGSQAAHRG